MKKRMILFRSGSVGRARRAGAGGGQGRARGAGTGGRRARAGRATTGGRVSGGDNKYPDPCPSRPVRPCPRRAGEDCGLGRARTGDGHGRARVGGPGRAGSTTLSRSKFCYVDQQLIIKYIKIQYI